MVSRECHGVALADIWSRPSCLPVRKAPTGNAVTDGKSDCPYIYRLFLFAQKDVQLIYPGNVYSDGIMVN